jgi:hypothetical protein
MRLVDHRVTIGVGHYYAGPINRWCRALCLEMVTGWGHAAQKVAAKKVWVEVLRELDDVGFYSGSGLRP